MSAPLFAVLQSPGVDPIAGAIELLDDDVAVICWDGNTHLSIVAEIAHLRVLDRGPDHAEIRTGVRVRLDSGRSWGTALGYDGREVVVRWDDRTLAWYPPTQLVPAA